MFIQNSISELTSGKYYRGGKAYTITRKLSTASFWSCPCIAYASPFLYVPQVVTGISLWERGKEPGGHFIRTSEDSCCFRPRVNLVQLPISHKSPPQGVYKTWDLNLVAIPLHLALRDSLPLKPSCCKQSSWLVTCNENFPPWICSISF